MKAPRIAQMKAISPTPKCEMDDLQCKSKKPPQFKLDDQPVQKKNDLPDDFLNRMSEGHGINAHETAVVTDSTLAEQSRAKAVSTGGEVHVAPGQFKREGDGLSKDTERLLSHEFAHERQKAKGEVSATTSINGLAVNDDKRLEDAADRDGDAVLAGKTSETVTTGVASSGAGQAYAEGTLDDAPAKVSKDLSLAEPNNDDQHALYAEAGKVEESNEALARTGAQVRLMETNESAVASDGTTKKTLKKILPQNLMNRTSGEDMQLYADCGRANSMVMGSLTRHANYNSLDGEAKQTESHGDPLYMKYQIFTEVYDTLKSDPQYADDRRIQRNVDRFYKYKEETFTLKAQMEAAPDDKTRERLRRRMDRAWKRMLDNYYLLPGNTKAEFDAKLGINRHANPDIGQGYTISSGGPDFGGMSQNTWNFHWGGVVMKSSDGKDNVTLENYAVGDWDAENNKWSFNMYGPAEEDGQTFHDVLYGSRALGTKPTTLSVARSFNGSRR